MENNKNELINNHYRLNFKKLFKTALRRVPNNSSALAEEVVQETYARALKYFLTYDVKKDFDIWVQGIFRNACNDCRTTESGSGGIVMEYDDNTMIEMTKDEYKNLNHIILEIYNVFNKRNNSILYMYYILGYTSKDISVYLHMSHSNIRQIIFNFKNKINEIYSGSN